MLKQLPVRGRGAAGVACVALVLLAGCEQPGAEPTVAEAEQVDSPEAHLENVMRRLEFALDRAKADESTGVSSDRECEFKFLAPENAGDPVAAVVTIRRSVSVTPPAPPADKTPPSAGAAAEPVTEREAPEPIESVEQTTYTLHYKNEHWELVDPPQSQLPATESICFQYALSDG